MVCPFLEVILSLIHSVISFFNLCNSSGGVSFCSSFYLGYIEKVGRDFDLFTEKKWTSV